MKRKCKAAQGKPRPNNPPPQKPWQRVALWAAQAVIVKGVTKAVESFCEWVDSQPPWS